MDAALTTKVEAFRESPNGEWSGLGPSICLVTSTEEVRDDDDTSACVAISFFFSGFLQQFSEQSSQ